MNAPATPLERVRMAVIDYLATPESYPLVVPVKDDLVQDQLVRAHAKAERRRFDDAARITAMGDLA